MRFDQKQIGGVPGQAVPVALAQRETSQPVAMSVNVLPVFRSGPLKSETQPLTIPLPLLWAMVQFWMKASSGRQFVMRMAASLFPGPQP